MKSLLYTTAIAVFLTTGCVTGATAQVDAPMDSNFRLGVGQTSRVLTEEIEITFVSVKSDSRCPKGEMCVWPGDAVLQISVRVRGKDFGQYELHTFEREGSVASFDSFHVRLIALSPMAISGKTIAADEYIAVLRIAKGYAGNDGLH